MGVLPFRRKPDVSFKIHSEGRSFDVEASDARGGFELHAEGFVTTQGLVSALSASQSHAGSLGVREPMKISIRPSGAA